MASTRRTIDRSAPSRPCAAPRRLAVGFLAAALLGCGPEAPEGVIDREVFIEAYVDLRVAALEAEDRQMSEAVRAEVLARHGIEAEDLLEFAEVHARDLELMRDVWNEVELRMDAMRPEAAER